jgi:hypothetical protein
LGSPFEYAREEHDRIREAVKDFAKAIGCDMSEEGAKQFARIVMVAFAEAAFEGGDIFEGVARKLLTFRPRPTKVAHRTVDTGFEVCT